MADQLEMKEKLLAGLNCAQCVFGNFAERFDYSEEEFYRIAAGFGGGMFRGDTCGTVTGAIMTLGVAFGDDSPKMHEKVQQFRDAFIARYGTTCCRELLPGYDFSKPGEHDRAVADGVTQANCPGFICSSIEILEELLKE